MVIVLEERKVEIVVSLCGLWGFMYVYVKRKDCKGKNLLAVVFVCRDQGVQTEELSYIVKVSNFLWAVE